MIQPQHGEVEFYCEECQASAVVKDESKRVIKVTKHSPIGSHVLIYVVRHAYDAQTKAFRKLKTKVKLDDVITFNDASFAISGVICHAGETLNSGHYTTHVKNGDAWTLYDDDCVTTSAVGPSETECYIIVYKKKKLGPSANLPLPPSFGIKPIR